MLMKAEEQVLSKLFMGDCLKGGESKYRTTPSVCMPFYFQSYTIHTHTTVWQEIKGKSWIYRCFSPVDKQKNINILQIHMKTSKRQEIVLFFYCAWTKTKDYCFHLVEKKNIDVCRGRDAMQKLETHFTDGRRKRINTGGSISRTAWTSSCIFAKPSPFSQETPIFDCPLPACSWHHILPVFLPICTAIFPRVFPQRYLFFQQSLI